MRLTAALSFTLCVVLGGGDAQAQASADSLRLRYTRIRAEPTKACTVVVLTSGSMNIEAIVTPADLRQWIDSATAIAAASPVRAKGQRVRLAWIPLTLGFMRTITDRFDAVALTNSAHELPILRSELPRIVSLFDSAAVRAERLSAASGACDGVNRSPSAPHNEEL